MKHLAALTVLMILGFSQAGEALVDFACSNNCTQSGSSYSFCQSKCTVDDKPSTRSVNVDYNCVNQCTEQGSMYNFCTKKCSY